MQASEHAYERWISCNPLFSTSKNTTPLRQSKREQEKKKRIMSRSTNAVAATRLLLVSLPFALAYPRLIPPFELLNATSAAAPASTGVAEETSVYNYSDATIAYSYFTPTGTPTASGTTTSLSGSSTAEPVPEFTATPISDPGMTPPLDPIFVPPVYPYPPTTPATFVSVRTFLDVIQPLLDIIQGLLPPAATDMFRPYSTRPVEKRSTAAAGLELPFDINTIVVALVKQIQSILASIKLGGTADAVPLGAATGAVGTVTNTVGAVTGGLPVGGLTSNLGGVTGGLPVGTVTGVAAGLPIVGGLTSGLGGIAGRALRRRQLAGLGNVVGLTKPIQPLVQSVTGVAGNAGNVVPGLGALPVNPGSVLNTATGALSGNSGSLNGLPVDPTSLVNTATGTVGSVTNGLPVVNNVVPGGLSITGNLPSLDPSSLVNTVAGAAGGVNVVGNLPVDPSTIVGTVTNALPAPVANIVPTDGTVDIFIQKLALVTTLLNTVLTLLTSGGLGGLAKRSTTATLFSMARPELHKRKLHYPVPARKMRHGERKRQSPNADLGASSLDNAAHLSFGDLMALLGPNGSLDPMGLMAQEDQSDDAYYASAPGGEVSTEQYYPPMGDDVMPAFEGYSE